MTSIVNLRTILKTDSYNEINASESDSEEKQDGDSREILGKDGYVW